MEEIWKDIEGYEGKYQISNLGRIRILKIMILQETKHGYISINLYKNGKSRRQTVHRLVAKHFIPNLQNKRCVNHIDSNRKNNRVDNLEWCTDKENMQHSMKYGYSKNLLDRLQKIREKRKKKINQYDLDGNFIKQWNSLTEAAKMLGKKKCGAISNCCKNRNKTAYGYKWQYAEGGETDV